MTFHKLFLAATAALGVTTAARAVTFDLGSVASGAIPTFSIVAGGVTETYSSVAGNGFATQTTSGLFTFTPALVDNNFFGSDNLTITFSTPQTSQIIIPFGFVDAPNSGDTLKVTTNLGQQFTFGSLGDGLALNEPEGTVKVLGTGITSLTLSSSVAFDVGSTSVPEPLSLSLLGAGLFGLAVSHRRAR